MNNRLIKTLCCFGLWLAGGLGSVAVGQENSLLSDGFESPLFNTSSWWKDGGDVVEGPDLRTIAITPYGAWFEHLAEGSRYRPTILWSTQPFSTEQQAQFSDEWPIRQKQQAGQWTAPYFTLQMQPDTTYYVRVKRNNTLTAMLQIRTRPLVEFRSHEFGVSASTLAQLKQAYQAGEMDRWLPIFRARAGRTYAGTFGARFAFAAALLYRISELPSDRENAMARWANAVQEKDGVGESNSSYRYKSSHLSLSTALLWEELSPSQRNEALLALIDDDEQDVNLTVPLDDTDRHIASTHIQLTSGFLAAAPGVPADLRARFDAVYEVGLKNWEGVFKAKMRLDSRKYGISGGSMDDGTDYGVGTAFHWLEVLWAYEQMGSPETARYAPWIRNHIRQKIHQVVPDGSGRFSYGDVESGDRANNGSTYESDWSMNMLLAYFANRYGYTEEANHLYHMMDLYNGEPTDDIGGYELLEHSAIAGAGRIPLDYVDSGLGIVYSRTDWGLNASALMALFGWRGVHHHQEDRGHVSWWADGGWKLHETPHYGYDSSEGLHNVPPGQFGWGDTESGFSPMIQYLTSPGILSLTMDLTEGYRNSDDEIFPYQSVTRSVVWDKTSNQLTVRDSFQGGAPAVTSWIGPARVTRSDSGQTVSYQMN